VAAVAACAATLPPASADGPGYRFFKTAPGSKKPGAYWNPCSTIVYGIDFTYAKRAGMRPAWERQRWQSVIAEVGQAMGVGFRYAGAIRSRSAGRYPTSTADVDIVITFGGPARKGRYAYGRVLQGPVAGVGGVSWRSTSRAGRSQVFSGYVVIDAQDVVRRTEWQRRFDDRPAEQRPPDVARALYMHEFGHAVGLDHVRDQRQLMYPQLQPDRPDALGAGDRKGLRLLGRQPCF
jgi:hypothetical protein